MVDDRWWWLMLKNSKMLFCPDGNPKFLNGPPVCPHIQVRVCNTEPCHILGCGYRHVFNNRPKLDVHEHWGHSWCLEKCIHQTLRHSGTLIRFGIPKKAIICYQTSRLHRERPSPSSPWPLRSPELQTCLPKCGSKSEGHNDTFGISTRKKLIGIPWNIPKVWEQVWHIWIAFGLGKRHVHDGRKKTFRGFEGPNCCLQV